MKLALKMSNQIRFNVLVWLTIVSKFLAIFQVIHSAEVLSDSRYKPVALAESVKVINGNNNDINSNNGPLNGVEFVNANAPVLDKIVQSEELGPPLMKSGPYRGRFLQPDGGMSNIDGTIVDADEDDMHPDDPIEESYMMDQYNKIKNLKDNSDSSSGQRENLKTTTNLKRVVNQDMGSGDVEAIAPNLADENSKINFPLGTSLTKPIYPDRVTRNGTKTISHYKIMVPVWIPHKMPDGADIPVNRMIMSTTPITSTNDVKDIKINRSIQSVDRNRNVIITNDPALEQTKLVNPTIVTNNPNGLARSVNPTIVKNNPDGHTEIINPALVAGDSDGVKVAKTVRELHKTYEPKPVPQTVLTKYVMRKDKNTPYNMSPNVDPLREIVLGESESVYDQ